MIILRDDERIARLRRVSQYTSVLGLLALIAGLVLAFINPERLFFFEFLALMAGWLLSQVGTYLGQRYMRTPRPDEVLDKDIRRVAKDGRIYHYLLPAPHVLLTPQGIIILVAKFQGGKISVHHDKWKQSGVGLRKWFGNEAIGNPTKEAEAMVGAIANYLRKNAPEVEEVPIAPVIVFTSMGTQELEIGEVSYPVLHHNKLKGFLRQQRSKNHPALPKADYEAIKSAFDKKAAHLIEITAVDDEPDE